MTPKEPVYYVLKRRIPCHQEWLGRIVLHFQDPTACYIPEEAAVSQGLCDILVTTETDFDMTVKASRDEALKSRLTRLLDLNREVNREEEVHFQAPLVIKRSLTNYKAAFERLKQKKGVIAELLDMLPRGRRAYMVVGVVEIEKASTDHSKATSRSADVGASLPLVDVALAAASVPISLGDIGDIDLRRKLTKSDGVETKSRAPAREIFAMEYRVIRRNLIGFGQHLEYRDSIPRPHSSLALHDSEEDKDSDSEDEKVPVREFEIIDEGLSLGSVVPAFEEELIRDADTGFIYNP